MDYGQMAQWLSALRARGQAPSPAVPQAVPRDGLPPMVGPGWPSNGLSRIAPGQQAAMMGYQPNQPWVNPSAPGWGGIGRLWLGGIGVPQGKANKFKPTAK